MAFQAPSGTRASPPREAAADLCASSPGLARAPTPSITVDGPSTSSSLLSDGGIISDMLRGPRALALLLKLVVRDVAAAGDSGGVLLGLSTPGGR